MKTWRRLLLVLMSVGGGFTGFTLCLRQLLEMLNSNSQAPFNLLIMLVFLGLFGFVTASGLMFVHDEKRTRPLLISLALQIPWVSSSLIVYKFATAMHLALSIGNGDSGVRFNAEWLVGSSFQFAIFQTHPLQFGINVVPIVLLILVTTSQLPQRIKVQAEVV